MLRLYNLTCNTSCGSSRKTVKYSVPRLQFVTYGNSSVTGQVTKNVYQLLQKVLMTVVLNYRLYFIHNSGGWLGFERSTNSWTSLHLQPHTFGYTHNLIFLGEPITSPYTCKLTGHHTPWFVNKCHMWTRKWCICVDRKLFAVYLNECFLFDLKILLFNV